jgi:predicted transcriptional regulator
MYHRPAPTVDALLALLKQDTTGIGVTTAELAKHMGRSNNAISSKLSKMRSYGYVMRITASGCPQELVRWKVRD